MGAADEARHMEVGEMEVDGERHRSNERRERHRREERDHHGSGRKDKDRDRDREKEKEKEEKRRERDDSRYRDRDRDIKHRERESERERGRDRGKDRERESERERDRERENYRDRRDREKERSRNRDKEKDRERVDRERPSEKSREREDRDREKLRGRDGGEDDMDLVKGVEDVEKPKADAGREAEPSSTSELRERLTKVKEERLKEKNEETLKDKTDDTSEILSWVGKSRKLEEKRSVEKEKALRRARALEEQDNILAESDDDEDEEGKQGGDHLAGVKVLHGLDKVMEGGAIVLTLKDQSILAGGDINEEADMLENIEIGEQKQRDEAFKAAKKTGTYDDKFNDDSLSKKPILSHYDDPMEDEGVTLDEGGRFTGEAEKKLEELRKRIEGGFVQKKTEDLTSSTKISSDYYTPDELLQFKKPKKKKSLRKKEKLDLDALEAEAIAAGLGTGDLGSRKDARRQAAREEEQKADAEKRSNAYQAAIAKAEEASKALRQEKSVTVKPAEEEELVFGEDYEDLQKSLEQARKLALRKQDEAAPSGPQAVAESATAIKGQEDTSAAEGEAQQNKVVITEMEEFVWGLQLNEETHKPEAEDVFMDEDDDIVPSHNKAKDDSIGLTEVKEKTNIEEPTKDEKEDVKPDEIIHEVAVGKGLSGALRLLQDRGTLNEGIEWGGRTTDKKKSKLVGLEDGPKEIRIERHDEFGRVMTPKEAFRMLSHKFHGKGPGKMKLEKRMKKFQEDLKAKQMKSSDTPLMAMEKMREAQARMQAPYLVLSGNAKTGQTSDPQSGFATVEKGHPGSLTPMLGDKKVEHFLGIKRNAEPGSMPPPPPKKPKT